LFNYLGSDGKKYRQAKRDIVFAAWYIIISHTLIYRKT
jgi:hypothetical protein